VRTRDVLGVTDGALVEVDVAASRVGLARVEHQALAEHGVEDLLGPAGELGGLGDVPHQELVVRLHQRVVVVGGPTAHLSHQ
jgi:hypothetical protein